MASGHGGPRPGAGRKPKSETYASEVQQAERRIADRLPELIDNLLRLAGGVQVYRPRKGQEPITSPDELAESDDAEFYITPPDFKANAYLIDRILGKPTERHEHTGEDGGPIEVDATVRSEAARELDEWRKSMAERLPPRSTGGP